ncbi:MAG: type II secretion system protein, partial [Planctomycetota bacterium]
MNQLLMFAGSLGSCPRRCVVNVGRSRRGFSLLEVILAIAVLGATTAVMVTIVDRGADAAIESRQLATLQMLAETKMT